MDCKSNQYLKNKKADHSFSIPDIGCCIVYAGLYKSEACLVPYQCFRAINYNFLPFFRQDLLSLHDLNKWSRGRVARQRSAKPCTAVRIRP
jgi:hypothetical protein